MPAWATIVLTLGVAVVTGTIGYITQYMMLRQSRLTQLDALCYDQSKQLRAEAYDEFRMFMLIVAAAVDATIFAVRNLDPAPGHSQETQADALVADAVEKVRQVRVHAPLMRGLSDADATVGSACDELLWLLGKTSYSLRRLTGATAAAGDVWDAAQIEEALRPRADQLQTVLSAAAIRAIQNLQA